MQFGFGTSMTQGVKNLLIANGIVYVILMFFGRQLIPVLGLVPYWAWSRLYLWQFVTYLFLHGGFLHLLLNMYALWVFGTEVESMWGTHAFYRYYFITGIGAGIIHTLITPFSTIPTIGASGAIMGVLLAFGLMFPHREITLLLFFILPVRMKAWQLVLLFAGISLISGVAGSPDGVAHFAHLGGMLVGYIYLRTHIASPLREIKNGIAQWRRKKNMKVDRERRENLERLRRVVDTILDKANEVGMENLTSEEKYTLKKASKILKREDN